LYIFQEFNIAAAVTTNKSNEYRVFILYFFIFKVIFFSLNKKYIKIGDLSRDKLLFVDIFVGVIVVALFATSHASVHIQASPVDTFRLLGFVKIQVAQQLRSYLFKNQTKTGRLSI
jgi:hypothetical protein